MGAMFVGVSAQQDGRPVRNGSSPGSALLTLSPRSPVDPFIPHSTQSLPPSQTMQSIRLQKKYPEVSQGDMFDLISRFKCVSTLTPWVDHNVMTPPAPLQRPPHRRPGARRQGYRIAGPPEPRRIVRSRTRDAQARLCGRQWQGRVGGLGRGTSSRHSPVFSRLFNLSRLTKSPSDSSTLSSALRLLPSARELGRSPCKVPTQTSAILSTRMSDESSRITSTG